VVREEADVRVRRDYITGSAFVAVVTEPKYSP